uniref:Microtubule-associated protein Jupiter n=1 Tax=Strongyloides stercoralis TaxID=6248 RepID=A0A0K0EHH6_STRER
MSKQTMEFDAISKVPISTCQRSSSGSGKMLSLPTMFGINRTKSSTDVREKDFSDLRGLNNDNSTNFDFSNNHLYPQSSIKKKNSKYSSSADVSRVGDDVIQNCNRSTGGSHGKNSPINKSNDSLNSEK